MNRTEVAVYDAYPDVVNALVTTARHMAALPLHDLDRVLDRVEQAGCYNNGGRTTPMPPEVVAQHRALAAAARAFRDAAAAALTATPGGGG